MVWNEKNNFQTHRGENSHWWKWALSYIIHVGGLNITEAIWKGSNSCLDLKFLKNEKIMSLNIFLYDIHTMFTMQDS